MTQPPIQTRRKLSIIDYICFGLVGAIIAYAVYRVSDVLVYNWNWSRVLNFVIYYDEESASYVPNLLLKGIATTLRLAFWATLAAAIIGLVMGFMRTSKIWQCGWLAAAMSSWFAISHQWYSFLFFTFSSPDS